MNRSEFADLQALIRLRWPRSEPDPDPVLEQAFRDLAVADFADALAALDSLHGQGRAFPPTSSEIRDRITAARVARLNEERRRRPALPESTDRRAGLVGFAEDHDGLTPSEYLRRLTVGPPDVTVSDR